MEACRFVMLVCLVLLCWCRCPAGAVEIRLARDLDTNSTFMAPRPTPPEPEKISIPSHNLANPAHNYTHAVVGRNKYKVWIRQLHYRVGDEVRVDKVVVTEVFNDTKALFLRGETTVGAGVCLVELHKNTTDANTTDAAAAASVSVPLQESMVTLNGPLVATKGAPAAFCRRLPVYKVHPIPASEHRHPERTARYVYKSTMRALAFVWRNRRILGMPFGVQGDFEYRG